MTKSILIAITMLTAAVTTAHAGTNDGAKKKSRTDTIAVPEMQCGMCEERIETALEKLKGVTSATADAEANRVIVTYNPSTTTRTKLEKAIAKVGYDAGSHEATAAAQAKLHGCCKPE